MNTDLEPYQGGTPEPYDRPQVPTIAGTRPRLPEVGRIRLGDVKQPNKPGAKLGTLRFTSRDRSLIEAVAARYGGQVKPWDSDEGKQWQVISETSTIPVVVPRADLAFSQYYELWASGGCQRRCDGRWEMVSDRQCICNPAARECKPTTRLSVMLPGVRGMGLWRVESHGDNARAEILGSIELASMYGASLVPANLTVVERWSRQPNPKKPGEFVKVRFVVPILVISDSIDEYVARAKEMQAAELGLLPSGNDLAGPTTMRKLRATVFALWPESDQPGPERDRRLRQLSHMLGREVLTISNDHDLTESEARHLASMVNELHEDPTDESTPALTRGQAAPISPGAPSAAGADSTAPQGSAGAGTRSPSGREASDKSSPAQAGHGQPSAPAEHHTNEAKGSAPADGTVPAGESRSDAGLPPGAAPATPTSDLLDALKVSVEAEKAKRGTPPAPTRKRHKTDPTGAPNVARAMKEAQQFRDERKAQTEVERTPADPIQVMPPKFRDLYLKHFGNELETAAGVVNAHIEAWGPKYPATGDGAPWSLELLRELAADTFEKDQYR